MLPAEMDVLVQNKQVCHVGKCTRAQVCWNSGLVRYRMRPLGATASQYINQFVDLM